MQNENLFSDFINEVAIQTKMENVWSYTCGSWENCNRDTIQSFLGRCFDYHIDPNYCMSWIEQHKDYITDWKAVSEVSLEWIEQHTSNETDLLITE